jgi:transcription elongation factor GreB
MRQPAAPGEGVAAVCRSSGGCATIRAGRAPARPGGDVDQASGKTGKGGSITPEGYARLQAELQRLWTQDRPAATRDVQAAAAHGDRSENAEYQYGKRRLREIDQRIRVLAGRLEKLQVVDHRGRCDERILFGAWVTLETEDGAERCYRIVGSDESDPARGCISVESPLGSSLLGKRVGDEVTVSRPAGEAVYVVLEVRY